jgi:hypothetical protein
VSDAPKGWLSRLKSGLSRSSQKLTEGITGIFTRRKLDNATLDELEELLIASDMGLGLADEVTSRLRRTRFGQEVSPEEVRGALAEEIAKSLSLIDRPLRLDISSSSWSASTAAARRRPSASSPSISAMPATAWSWRRATPSAPRRSSSSRSGASAPARR